MPLLRIVPDDTKFDFMRFRRISFPISALLSIAAILLFFFHGLNFGIDFVGGTLIEVQSKSGPADLAKLRGTLGGLGLGDVQLQQFGAPENVLIRVAQQPGGEQAQQAALIKVRQIRRQLPLYGTELQEEDYRDPPAHYFGVPAVGVRSADALQAAVTKALGASGPTVIEAVVDSEHYVDTVYD